MADDPSTIPAGGPPPPRRSDADKPVGYWVYKTIIGVGAVVVLIVDLIVTDAEISAAVYGLLFALAGGPEFVELVRRGH